MDNLEFYKEKINNALRVFLNKKLNEDGKYSPQTAELIKNIIEFNLRGGKRIRPLTCIFVYKCFEEDYGEKIINASIFVELMQAYLLIHDDIIDKAELRRGKASMHKIYSKEYGKDYGISVAILAGNLCSSYAYDSILESYFSDEQKLRALEYVGWINNRENYGQALDILPGFEKLKEKDILKIYELKTATYTFQGPVYAGCALAGASLEKTAKLQEYAYNLGIAFQIQDDINGIFGELDKMGKPNDSDIKEGKKTLLIVKALELCSPDDKKFLLSNYGSKDIDAEVISKIKSIIKNCGSYGYCLEKFRELIKKSKETLSDLEIREEGKRYLVEMADYINGLV